MHNVMTIIKQSVQIDPQLFITDEPSLPTTPELSIPTMPDVRIHHI